MEGRATIDEKPATLYLQSAKPPSRSSTPHPPDQTQFPGPFMQYGYPPAPIAIPQVAMPMWSYPAHGPTGASQPGQIFAPAPMMNSTHVPGNFTTSDAMAIKIPDVASWFSYLDRHEQRNKDEITFAPYGVMLKAKGFLRLSQLTLEYVQLRDLQEWLGIEVGTAILIMQYAKEDLEALKSGKWVFPTNL